MNKKKLYKIGTAAMSLLLLASCSPDDFAGADQNGIPTLDGVDAEVTVDQSTNEMTATMANLPKGTYPIWFYDNDGDGTKETYSTLQSLSKVINKAGDYSIEYRLGNRNGFSQASGIKTFHVDNSLADPVLMERIIGKEWRIDYAEPAHLACGDATGDGTGWWNAAANEKADWGVYDDRISFTADGTYTYDPGEGGTMYVNTGSGLFSDYNTNDGQDYMVPVEKQNGSFSIEMEGDTRYLVLSSDSYFPYISAAGQYSNPKFRIEDITSTKLILVYEGNNINWHFIFTSKEDEPAQETFKGYKFDSDCNMWKNAIITNDFYYADANWSPYAEHMGFKATGNQSYDISLTQPTASQWQAQVKFFTDMASNSATHYDFSAALTATNDIKGVTVKLTKHGDDDTFYFADQIDLAAGDTYYFYKDNMEGIDMDNVDLVLDFGGAPAGTDVNVSDVVFKEHGCDDGSGHPQEAVDNKAYEYNDPENLWQTVDAGNPEMFYYYADANWTAYPENQGFAHDGNTYTLTFPYATAAQWQNQIAFYTNLSCKKDDKYDFGCIMNPSTDLNNVTVKLVKHGEKNDGIFFFANQVNLVGGEDNVIKFPAQVSPDDMESIDLFLDFGGNPENTTVTLKDIVLKKSK